MARLFSGVALLAKGTEKVEQVADAHGAVLVGVEIAGGKMKEVGVEQWDSPNTNATNSSGWTGLPGFYRSSSNGAFSSAELTGSWRTASANGSDAWYSALYYDNESVNRGIGPRENGCLFVASGMPSEGGVLQTQP